jgi:NADH-quinone oxidoreductase subunit I
MCCSTICPANCIHIEAAEHDDPTIEKYPRVFVIDELRCIVCGLCVEACPCDAIRMDTGVHMKPRTDRTTSFHQRDELMQLGGLSIATRGGQRAIRDGESR